MTIEEGNVRSAQLRLCTVQRHGNPADFALAVTELAEAVWDCKAAEQARREADARDTYY